MHCATSAFASPLLLIQKRKGLADLRLGFLEMNITPQLSFHPTGEVRTYVRLRLVGTSVAITQHVNELVKIANKDARIEALEKQIKELLSCATLRKAI